MSDRRYSESEIREVFERAAREQEHSHQRSSQEGLTLAEMQEVAASAGIDPEFVAAAAQSVALGEPEEGRLMMGPVPRGVFRTDFLPGPPTDALWDHVVADARRTFSAEGKVRVGGGVREWRNGNLRVILEPAGDGSRLHLRTRRDDRTQLMVTAAALSAVALFMALFSSLNAFSDPEAFRASLFVAIGSALGAAGLWSGQRSWADTRERQMAELSERAASAAPADLPTPRISSAPTSGRIDLDALGLADPEAGDMRTDARSRTR